MIIRTKGRWIELINCALNSSRPTPVLSSPVLSSPASSYHFLSSPLLSSPLLSSLLALPWCSSPLLLLYLSSCYHYHYFLPLSIISHMSCFNSSPLFDDTYQLLLFTLSVFMSRERTGVHPMPRTYALLVRCANAHLG